MLRLRIASGILALSSVFPMACGANPDATGETGIGAPGKVDPNVPVLSDEEAYKEQLKQEAIMEKASRGR